jgi:hypothetical protein
LDGKEEEEGLLEDEITKLHDVTSVIHSMTRMQTSIQWQQSRLLWLREGDANSKYYHSILKSRRKRNALTSIMVDGTRVEGAQPVRQVVYAHFSSHFRSVKGGGPAIQNFESRRRRELGRTFFSSRGA